MLLLMEVFRSNPKQHPFKVIARKLLLEGFCDMFIILLEVHDLLF